MSNPRVTVVIINWNHGDFIEACLLALRRQSFPDLEVVVVDNASRDGSADQVAREFPEVKIFRLDTNTGFSRAFNFAARQTKSEFLLSLNPDVTVERNFVEALINAMAQDPMTGSAAPRLLRADNDSLIDSAGLFINRSRRPYDRLQMMPNNASAGEALDVFGACGAAVLFRRKMIEDLAPDGEFFDEDFFAYYEDADVAWRAQLRGWRCIYVPSAVGRHVRGWGDTLFKASQRSSLGPRLALRNRYLMILKNDSWFSFLHDSPWILWAEIPRLLVMALARPKALLGLVDFLRLAPSILRKRARLSPKYNLQAVGVRNWFLLKPEQHL